METTLGWRHLDYVTEQLQVRECCVAGIKHFGVRAGLRDRVGWHMGRNGLVATLGTDRIGGAQTSWHCVLLRRAVNATLAWDRQMEMRARQAEAAAEVEQARMRAESVQRRKELMEAERQRRAIRREECKEVLCRALDVCSQQRRATARAWVASYQSGRTDRRARRVKEAAQHWRQLQAEQEWQTWERSQTTLHMIRGDARHSYLVSRSMQIRSRELGLMPHGGRAGEPAAPVRSCAQMAADATLRARVRILRRAVVNGCPRLREQVRLARVEAESRAMIHGAIQARKAGIKLTWSNLLQGVRNGVRLGHAVVGLMLDFKGQHMRLGRHLRQGLPPETAWRPAIAEIIGAPVGSGSVCEHNTPFLSAQWAYKSVLDSLGLQAVRTYSPELIKDVWGQYTRAFPHVAEAFKGRSCYQGVPSVFWGLAVAAGALTSEPMLGSEALLLQPWCSEWGGCMVCSGAMRSEEQTDVMTVELALANFHSPPCTVSMPTPIRFSPPEPAVIAIGRMRSNPMEAGGVEDMGAPPDGGNGSGAAPVIVRRRWGVAVEGSDVMRFACGIQITSSLQSATGMLLHYNQHRLGALVAVQSYARGAMARSCTRQRLERRAREPSLCHMCGGVHRPATHLKECGIPKCVVDAVLDRWPLAPLPSGDDVQEGDVVWALRAHTVAPIACRVRNLQRDADELMAYAVVCAQCGVSLGIRARSFWALSPVPCECPDAVRCAHGSIALTRPQAGCDEAGDGSEAARFPPDLLRQFGLGGGWPTSPLLL